MCGSCLVFHAPPSSTIPFYSPPFVSLGIFIVMQKEEMGPCLQCPPHRCKDAQEAGASLVFSDRGKKFNFFNFYFFLSCSNRDFRGTQGGIPEVKAAK